jgi:hypothetical protein
MVVVEVVHVVPAVAVVIHQAASIHVITQHREPSVGRVSFISHGDINGRVLHASSISANSGSPHHCRLHRILGVRIRIAGMPMHRPRISGGGLLQHRQLATYSCTSANTNTYT